MTNAYHEIGNELFGSADEIDVLAFFGLDNYTIEGVHLKEVPDVEQLFDEYYVL